MVRLLNWAWRTRLGRTHASPHSLHWLIQTMQASTLGQDSQRLRNVPKLISSCCEQQLNHSGSRQTNKQTSWINLKGACSQQTQEIPLVLLKCPITAPSMLKTPPTMSRTSESCSCCTQLTRKVRKRNAIRVLLIAKVVDTFWEYTRPYKRMRKSSTTVATMSGPQIDSGAQVPTSTVSPLAQ